MYFHYSRMARQIELLFSKYSSNTHLIVWNGVKDYRGIAAAVARKRLWNITSGPVLDNLKMGYEKDNEEEPLKSL